MRHLTPVLIALLGLGFGFANPASAQDEGLYNNYNDFGVYEEDEFGVYDDEFGTYEEDEFGWYGYGWDTEDEWYEDEYGVYEDDYDWETEEEDEGWFEGWFDDEDDDWLF